MRVPLRCGYAAAEQLNGTDDLATHRRIGRRKGDNMIVSSEEGLKKRTLGVDFVILSHGPKSMVTKMLYKPEDNVPLHSHPNEQSGYVLSGKYRIKFSHYDQEICPGDSYSISADIEHSIEIIEAGEVLDFFAPPREDFM